jgi:uncharacterized protein YbaR (Trm112 family)
MNKSCQNCTQEFEVDSIDQVFYERMKVGAPTFCPTCRMQRRLATRNDRFLYKTKSALSSDSIITMYNPSHGFTVYEHKEWWSDDWDPLKYGRNFDFNKPFFEQFAQLQKVVPRFNIFNSQSENSDYVNYVTHSKNCYLTYGSWFIEDCMYCHTMNECKNCLDCIFVDKSELCYESVDCGEDFRAFFCQNCQNVSDCYFCFDCRGCRNCIGCYNLKNQEYNILNKKVSKEEFEKPKAKFGSCNSLQELKKYFEETIKKEAVHRDTIRENNHNATGDLLFNCKNAKHCFSTYRSEDIAYSARCFDQKDSYDFDAGGKGELLYENMSNDFSFNSISCTTSEYMINAHYCDLCFHCEDCFGCVGLRHKKYCIFNKQYSEEEYKELSAKIIEHMKKPSSGGQACEWGEFFPIKYSPFAYNETFAQEHYPLTKEEALSKDYKWQEDEDTTPQPQTYEIPDDIKAVPDQILNEVLVCESCNKNYKILDHELKFYRKENLAIPHICHNCRYSERFLKRPPRHLWDRTCSHCEKPIQTSYSPDKNFKIYCEECYLKEVY